MRTNGKIGNAKKVLGAVAVATLAGSLGCNQAGGAASSEKKASGAPAPAATPAATLGTSWSVSLIEARTRAAVATLGSGSVLVAGGRTAADDATDTVELLDADQGFSRPLPARLATARAGARAVTLADGRVLVLGGHDAHGQPLATTEIFDPLADAFAPGPVLAAAHDEPAIATVSSREVLVLGGARETSIESIDLVTLAAKKLAGSLAAGHPRAQAQVVGTVVVVAGGADAPEVFDLTTNTAKTPARTDDERTGEALVPVPGAVLLVGGTPAKGAVAASTHEIVAPFESIGAFHALGTARVLGECVPFGGGELVLGGHDGAGNLIAGTDLVQTALPSLDTVAGPELRSGRLESSTVGLRDGRVVVVGGLDAVGQPIGACEVLLPPGARVPDAKDAFAAARKDEQDRAKLSSDLSTETAQLASTTATLSSVTAAKSTEDQTLAATKARLAQATDDLKKTTTELHQTQTQLAQTQQQLQSTQQQLQSTQQQLQSTQQQLQATKAQLAQAQQALANANQAAQGAQSTISSLQNQLANAQATIQTLDSTIALKDARISQLQSALQAAPTPAPTASGTSSTGGSAPVAGSAAINSGAGTPNAVATPGTASAASSGLFVPFGNAWTNSISPNPARSGQEVLISVTTKGASLRNVNVYFSGVPATVTYAGFAQGQGEIRAIVPQLAPGQYKVQWSASNFMSSGFTFTVQ